MSAYPQTLDCQQCGDIIRRLDPAEAQRVADRPYDFIIYCRQCERDLTRGSM